MKNHPTFLIPYSQRFLVQGGDWGSLIGSNIATLFPENVIGFHSNMCSSLSPLAYIKGFIASFYPSLFIPDEFKDFVFPQSRTFAYVIEESGYFHIQATKPDTIGEFDFAARKYVFEIKRNAHFFQELP